MKNENLTSQQVFERMLPCRDDENRAEEFSLLNEKWRELFGKLSKELTLVALSIYQVEDFPLVMM